jgi:hypothetical protein
MFESINKCLFDRTNLKILALCLAALIHGLCNASVLTTEEQSKIEKSLSAIPVTRKMLWSLLYPANKKAVFDQEFQDELEGILKLSLLDGDTSISLLTPEIRNELDLDRWVAAFHKQGSISFSIIPSRAGDIQYNKQNDTIRLLTHPRYFSHAHNVFVADEEISFDLNPLSLLLHELSHAAFDQWFTKHPEKLENILLEMLPKTILQKLIKTGKNGLKEIDGDLYDLLSERYAFEFEYRLNRKITKVFPKWPFSFSYTEAPSEHFREMIEDYIRRHYDIDHPLLTQLPIRPLDKLLK